MSYYNRFGENYLTEMERIAARRDAVIDRATSLAPPDNELEAAANTEDAEILLNWVTVPDPREGKGDLPELEVLPVLSVEWLDDDSGFESMAGVTSLRLVGKLPSGEESSIGIMQLHCSRKSADPYLFVSMDQDNEVFTRWDSADAELFLRLAESVLERQPA